MEFFRTFLLAHGFSYQLLLAIKFKGCHSHFSLTLSKYFSISFSTSLRTVMVWLEIVALQQQKHPLAFCSFTAIRYLWHAPGKIHFFSCMCLFNYLTATNCLRTKKIIRAVFIIKLKWTKNPWNFFPIKQQTNEAKEHFHC